MNSWKLAAIFLMLVHLAVLFADFTAPYDPEVQYRARSFSPPSHLSLSWAGIFANSSPTPRKIRLFVNGHLFGVEGADPVFLLGSDEYGRDQLSRLIYGGRISLFAGLLATALSLALGAAAGVIAGYFGAWRDALIMRLVELFLALPWLYLLLTVRAVLPLSLGPQQTFLMLAGVIGLVGWARPARMIRGVVSSLRERPYVVAARGFGASDWHVFRWHILPDLGGMLLTQAAILVPQNVLAEVALSFVGVGVAEPAASWGGLLAYLQQLSVLACCTWMALPCCFLVLVFASFQRLADKLIIRSASVLREYETWIIE